MFWLLPIFNGLLLSFKADTFFGEAAFVGLAHYRTLLHDPRFFHALINTAKFAFGSLLTIIPLSISLAYLLFNLPPWAKRLAGFFLLLPGLTPPTVLAFLFLLVFSGEHGILNAIFITPLGFSPQNWITDPKLIQFSLVLQAIWRWTGFMTLFLLAGLEGIPRQYTEIARTEGASDLYILFKIKLPLLRNLLIFIALFLFLDAFILFEGAYVLLGSSGGTADAGLLLVAYAYAQAFSMGHFSYASAMSFSLVCVLISIVAVSLFIFKKRIQYEHS